MKKSTAEAMSGVRLRRACRQQVLCMQGRLHAYEAILLRSRLPLSWRWLALGIEQLITTNAAGGINESYREGDFCIMADQINMTGRNRRRSGSGRAC